MLTNKPGPQPSSASCVAGVLPRDQQRTVSRKENRAFARHCIESSRTIALRPLDDDRKPCGRWFLADIADVGKGGMCLIASEDQSLVMGQLLLMDLRAHPGFGQIRMQAQLRWLTRAHFALTFGVAFTPPLKEVPLLSMERRSTRRDPNEEDWAFEEERILALS
jgi:hypothetical protein